MVNDLIEKSGHPQSGYFLYNHEDLLQTLLELKSKKQKTVLIGVTYALLDFIEQYDIDFPELIVMETGGMKGKRKEMVREELHEQLTQGFGVKSIHSEYGMTELLSQAYSLGDGVFNCPNWMQVLIRDTNDPLSLVAQGRTGGINVIDLANLNSCSFIATQDLGKINPDQSFEVLGRFDHADIRGCNLLVQ
ncbi:Acyl-protein synthetase, LuxE [compost metagenome]